MTQLKRVHLSWIEKIRKNKARGIEAKDEQIEIKDLDGNVVQIPARLFFDAAVKGMGLLREHGFGTQAGERDISLEIKRPNKMYPGNYIVSIYFHNVWIHDIWCDKIERYGGASYCLYMKGENIGVLYSTKVKIADDVPITDKLPEELRIAGVEGFASMLLDVQRDCIRYRKMVLDVLNAYAKWSHPGEMTWKILSPNGAIVDRGALSAAKLQNECYSIVWDNTKKEFVYKE